MLYFRGKNIGLCVCWSQIPASTVHCRLFTFTALTTLTTLDFFYVTDEDYGLDHDSPLPILLMME